MDVKGPGPNRPPWQPQDSATTGEARAAAPRGAGESVAQPGIAPGTFGDLQASFQRADLHNGQWPVILRRSAEALVNHGTTKLGPLPPSDAGKIAGFIEADPTLSSQIFRYWDQHLT